MGSLLSSKVFFVSCDPLAAKGPLLFFVPSVLSSLVSLADGSSLNVFNNNYLAFFEFCRHTWLIVVIRLMKN